MPEENIRFRPRDEILKFEELERFVRVAAEMGVNKVRITGGEPLVRAQLSTLVQKLAEVPGIDDLALTTNGLLLAQHALPLKEAGLDRLNISLDGLREETFKRIVRREGLHRVLEGIQAAQEAGFKKLRLNAVAIRGITEEEIVPLGQFAREQQLELRFIEFMPLDAEANWDNTLVLSGPEIRTALEAEFGALVPGKRLDPSQPAVDYTFADGRGTIGFINPVSSPFCGDCNRLRITAEGMIRNCLFSNDEWDARAILRSSASDDDLERCIRSCVDAKKPGHGIDTKDFVKPQRAMYEIGG